MVNRIQNIQNLLFGIADVFPLHRLVFKLPVGSDQFDGSRKVVIHKPTDFRKFLRMFFHTGENFSGDRLQLEQLFGNFLSGQGVVGFTDFTDPAPPLGDNGFQPIRILLNFGFFRAPAACG